MGVHKAGNKKNQRNEWKLELFFRLQLFIDIFQESKPAYLESSVLSSSSATATYCLHTLGEDTILLGLHSLFYGMEGMAATMLQASSEKQKGLRGQKVFSKLKAL